MRYPRRRAPIVLALVWCATAAAEVLLVQLSLDSLEATSAPGVAGFTALMTAGAGGLAAVVALRLALGLTAAVLEIRSSATTSPPPGTTTRGSAGTVAGRRAAGNRAARRRQVRSRLVTPALRRVALVLLGGSLSVLVSVPAHASSASVAGDRPAATSSAPAASAADPTSAGGDMASVPGRWTPDRPARPVVRSTQPEVSMVTAAPRPGTSVDDEVAVRAGDTLWDIAARHLGPDASAVDIARAWPQWFEANREVVGDDPDLLRPGQLLRPPTDLR